MLVTTWTEILTQYFDPAFCRMPTKDELKELATTIVTIAREMKYRAPDLQFQDAMNKAAHWVICELQSRTEFKRLEAKLCLS